MNKKVERNYLEINSIEELNEPNNLSSDFFIESVDPDDFQLNKFFYKNVGKKHKWIDRLVWTETQWINYASNKNLRTFIFKNKEDLAGFFELIFHPEKREIEIAYFGLLEEYHNRKLGGYLLSNAIKKSFSKKKIDRVWVHTCTLDHKNALKNYLARGMTIYKRENIKI